MLHYLKILRQRVTLVILSKFYLSGFTVNLVKTELLVVSANPSFHHNFTIQLGTSTITPSKTTRNLGVMIDDKLNFSDHIAKTTRSYRFALFNIKNSRPFLSEHASQLLVQSLVLSMLDYCNALLAGLPASLIFSIFYLFVFFKKINKTSYVYCVRLTFACCCSFVGFDCFYCPHL